ncbi:hypothetical protein ACFW20_16105 [Streptomyces nigra]|uniref:hypothetical protein n=1 Tax=Streptomyces nigra TaxID=1827580 RepID=UPI0036837DAB
MSAQSDRRWARLAQELEFTQLPELRRQAEGWRNGLAGLTALLAVLVTLKGRDDLAQIPPAAQHAVGVLVGLAFLLLLVGSVFAVRAAHGSPGDRVLVAGQALRDWTRREITRVTRSLGVAAVCCVSGVALVAVAVVVVWVTSDSPPEHLVRVVTTSGERCGEFLGSGPDGVVLRTETEKRAVLAARTVTSVTPVDVCP